jgi:FixJ family two-component response regulator
MVITTRQRIAVVDDEVSVRKALQRLLRSAGMDVDVFASGNAFLRSLHDSLPDCLVLDLHMPDVNGFHVQERIVELGVRLPMLVITGHDTPEARSRAIAGGADVYLLKPIDDQVLLDGIGYAISRHGGQ